MRPATNVAFFETGPGSFISGGMFESNDDVAGMIPRRNLLVNIGYGFPKSRITRQRRNLLALYPARMVLLHNPGLVAAENWVC